MIIAILGEPSETVLQSAIAQRANRVVVIAKTPQKTDTIITDDESAFIEVAIKSFPDCENLYLQNNKTILTNDCLFTIKKESQKIVDLYGSSTGGVATYTDFFILESDKRLIRPEFLESIINSYDIGHNIMIDPRQFVGVKIKSLQDIVKHSKQLIYHIPIPTYYYGIE